MGAGGGTGTGTATGCCATGAVVCGAWIGNIFTTDDAPDGVVTDSAGVETGAESCAYTLLDNTIIEAKTEQ